jgi:hypothetical protein
MTDCAGESLPVLEEARVLIPDDPKGSSFEFVCKLLRRDLRSAESREETQGKHQAFQKEYCLVPLNSCNENIPMCS